MPVRVWLVVSVLTCEVARAATLVPIPTVPQPTLPPAGLEANKGQANANILFLSPGNGGSIAVTAQGVLYSPLGATLALVASNPNPAVSFSDPLPGFANSYTAADPKKWTTQIPRYSTAKLTGIYPGIDAQYTVDASGVLSLNLLLAAGVNPATVNFSIPLATSMAVGPTGQLGAKFGVTDVAPTLGYPGPVAFQTNASGQVSRNVSFVVQSTTTFGLMAQGLDPTLPLQITIQLNAFVIGPQFSAIQRTSDLAGNTFFVAAVADPAGKAAPFGANDGEGCGVSIAQPIACSDVAIYKYSASGALEFVTYLSGGTNEAARFVGLAPGGALVVAGSTDSADFPVTPGAVQPEYSGPSATSNTGGGVPVAGDFFAAVLDPATGLLQSATFLGGPDADTVGTAALGADGSLYFLPAFVVHTNPGMPVTGGALLSACESDPCQNGYVARLSPMLDKLIYGTYLPGIAQATAKLYSDGSVYYAGTAQSGFPTTPTAYQPNNAGGYDGIVARLDPTGSRLLFGTYYGGPNTDEVNSIQVAPDGSVWASTSSYPQACCLNTTYQVIRLDAQGSQVLATLPIAADAMTTDAGGNLFALAEGNIVVSPDAPVAGSCGGPAYVEISPTGQQLYATYLPYGYAITFDGADKQGTPYLDSPSGKVQLVTTLPTSPYVGCVVDAASFGNVGKISPGAIVTIFGSGMGPSPGTGFQLVNGLVPTSLGGTQVFIDGQPAPMLYSSYGQLNVIIPYSLAIGSKPTITVAYNGTVIGQLPNLWLQASGISIFASGKSALALNEDYTVNSPQSPAKPGSIVMLFGTGGGATDPPSVAGEVTPSVLRPLVSVPQVGIPNGPGSVFLSVQYAGTAPGLISGVTQINVKLPDVIPIVTWFGPGTVPLEFDQNGINFFSGIVAISIQSK